MSILKALIPKRWPFGHFFGYICVVNNRSSLATPKNRLFDHILGAKRQMTTTYRSLSLIWRRFDSSEMREYLRSELSELVLAYATTVHKLQGSEVDYMVMPLSMSHRPMLYRNLLYTGVSRARKLCALVGEEEAIHYAVENNPNSTRNSNFALRLYENQKRAVRT